jgi:hypothetical protein
MQTLGNIREDFFKAPLQQGDFIIKSIVSSFRLYLVESINTTIKSKYLYLKYEGWDQATSQAVYKATYKRSYIPTRSDVLIVHPPAGIERLFHLTTFTPQDTQEVKDFLRW